MERRYYHFLLLLIFFLPACSAVNSSKPQHTANSVAIASATAVSPLPQSAAIKRYLDQLAARGGLVGSVLVGQNGKIFSQGYGPADREQGIANTAQTTFRIGSISKQFTAMAILLLQERGKLRVQNSVCLYIAACPQAWQPITLHQLLIHTSGIPDYTNFSDFLDTWNQPTTPEQLIVRFKDKPLDFTPGKRWSYSNSGYVLLGYIIERVSGETYAEFLQRNIFGPLQMKHSGYDDSRPHLPEHATGYYAGYVKPAFYDLSVFYAAGALYSNVEDLYKWDQALMKHTLLPAQDEQAMFVPSIPCPKGGCLLRTDVGYGYGWFIADEPQGRLNYHLGRVDGYFSYNGFYPASHLAVVVLSNLEGTDDLRIATTLAGMVAKS